MARARAALLQSPLADSNPADPCTMQVLYLLGRKALAEFYARGDRSAEAVEAEAQTQDHAGVARRRPSPRRSRRDARAAELHGRVAITAAFAALSRPRRRRPSSGAARRRGVGFWTPKQSHPASPSSGRRTPTSEASIPASSSSTRRSNASSPGAWPTSTTAWRRGRTATSARASAPNHRRLVGQVGVDELETEFPARPGALVRHRHEHALAGLHVVREGSPELLVDVVEVAPATKAQVDLGQAVARPPARTAAPRFVDADVEARGSRPADRRRRGLTGSMRAR